MSKLKYIINFSELRIKDVSVVGGKNASLGEMINALTNKGVRVPDGFAITASAHRDFLFQSGVGAGMKKVLPVLNPRDLVSLKKQSAILRKMVLKHELPPTLTREITIAYKNLCKREGREVEVAVRSSATAEDLPNASFAGQFESFLNVRGEKALIAAVRDCYASFFTDRSLAYRAEKEMLKKNIFLSVGIQKMVRSDKASAGVIFTLDTESGFDKVVLINAAWGLGENVVKGRVNPDQYYVFKPTLLQGFKTIVGRKIGNKRVKLVYASGKSPTKNIAVKTSERLKTVLSDAEILQLARWAVMIEKHYKMPMDIEWAKDGDDGKLYIVQARPETVYGKKRGVTLEKYVLKKRSAVLLTGLSVGQKIASGPARVILGLKQAGKFRPGDILVTRMTDPDWVPLMKMAGAIITESGGRTSHAAIVSRELGTPCIVGAAGATKILRDNEIITVSCAEGFAGKVYSGALPYDIQKFNLSNFKKPKTKIMVNIGEPDSAFSVCQIPNDGVGLAREEFILSNTVKIHPLALIDYAKLKDRALSNKIADLTFGYADKKEFFVDKLSLGIGRIAAAFYPRPVIVRTSDFKTNEYAGLVGGNLYELAESNPMLGWRGASRYYDPRYKAAFLLECAAIKRAREKMGLSNIIVMIPFCRTPEEGRKVLEIMKSAGLEQGKNGLLVYVMIEIPSNVILANEFAQIFNGFSIGSNDLTQLTLGLDRDSELVSRVADERNEAVKILIKQTIAAAHKAKIPVGICGQAPSDFPDFAEFLVREGIDSISLNPDTIISASLKIHRLERILALRPRSG